MRPLTYVLLFILFLAFSTVAAAKAIELSDEDAATCEKEGGCIVVTRKAAEALLGLIDHLQKQLNEAKGKTCA